MSKSDLVSHHAARASVSNATADALVSAVFATVGEALARDESVITAGFATLTIRRRA